MPSSRGSSWPTDRTQWSKMHLLHLLHWQESSLPLEGNGNPLQCSCLETPRDRGAWWAAVYGVTQSRTWLMRLSSSSSSTIWEAYVCIHYQLQSKDSKEIKPVNPKGNQPWIFIGRTDAEAEAVILWPPDVMSRFIGKRPDAGRLKAEGEGDVRG